MIDWLFVMFCLFCLVFCLIKFLVSPPLSLFVAAATALAVTLMAAVVVVAAG